MQLTSLIRKSVTTAAVVTVLVIAGSSAAFADLTYVFVNAKGTQTDAQVQHAVHACDPGDTRDYGSAKLRKCMLRFGLRSDGVDRTPDKSPTTEQADVIVNFGDIKPKRNGIARGDSAREADAAHCNPNGSVDLESSQFKRCMLTRGWRFLYAEQNPDSRSYSDADADLLRAQQNADDTSRRVDDTVRHDDEMNALNASLANQAATDAANAAAAAATSAGINQ